MEAHIYPKGCVFETLEDIKNKRVTVMGLGLNGGGEACVKFFLKHGAYVIATDMKTKEQLAPTIQSISGDKTFDHSRLTYVLGGHRIEDFTGADCVIKNPGIRIEGNKFLAAAKAIETDISIFLHFTKAPIIAVTGSKGKSSTVSAIEYGLNASGFKAFLGGNITVSPLTFLDQTDGTTPVVLELSSWQLADLRGRGALKPKIAVITKIVPDHQNWYHDMDSYVNDKKLIFADQDERCFTILDADSDGYLTETANPKPECKCWGDLFASETKGQVLRYSTEQLKKGMYGVFQKKDDSGNFCGILSLPFELRNRHAQTHGLETECIMKKLLVPGDHMRLNVLNASLVLYLMGIVPQQIQTVMGAWKGIPHRLELFHEWPVTEKHKVIFYNDSCATVPEAAAAASQSFSKRVIIICGGTDKQLDFTPLAGTLNCECGTKFRPLAVYLLSGTGTDKLTPMLDAKKVPYEGPFDSLEVLLNVLRTDILSKRSIFTENDTKNVTVVFSPGATSFGMFTNEFDRGNKFKKIAAEIFK